jgi:hypothetical protein
VFSNPEDPSEVGPLDLPVSTALTDPSNPRLQWLYDVWVSMFDTLSESDISSGKPDAAAALLKTVPVSILNNSKTSEVKAMIRGAIQSLIQINQKKMADEVKRLKEMGVSAKQIQDALNRRKRELENKSASFVNSFFGAIADWFSSWW